MLPGALNGHTMAGGDDRLVVKQKRTRKKEAAPQSVQDKTPILTKTQHKGAEARSVTICIPQLFAQALHLHPGDDVAMWKDGDVLIISTALCSETPHVPSA